MHHVRSLSFLSRMIKLLNYLRLKVCESDTKANGNNSNTNSDNDSNDDGGIILSIQINFVPHFCVCNIRFHITVCAFDRVPTLIDY